MKTLIKHYHFGILLFVIVALSGCVLPAPTNVPEINYRGQLPKSTIIDRETAIAFADDFAVEAGMGITDISPATGFYANKTMAITFGGPNPWVVTVIDNSSNQIRFAVCGNINSPDAKRIADKGVELFQKKYPEGSIAAYTPHKNWLGY
jgi:hypothetical protein